MDTTAFPQLANVEALNVDRFGALASALCAIHCAITPFLLLILPSFGRVWAHPASHWGMALLVVPVASVTVVRGFRRHRRKWIVGCGSLGVLLVLVGAVLPYLESGGSSASASCADSCCPSTTRVSGTTVVQIPPASIVTTLGGIALIITHLGNLSACRKCCRNESRPAVN